MLGLCAVLFSGSIASAADMDAQAKMLAKLDGEWSDVAVKKDMDRLASYYAEDAIVYPPNAPAAMGREAAKKVWAAFLSDPSAGISWKVSHAEVSTNSELGFTAGTYEASFKGPDGKPGTQKGKYLCVWKKGKDGKWKAIHDIWNSDSA